MGECPRGLRKVRVQYDRITKTQLALQCWLQFNQCKAGDKMINTMMHHWIFKCRIEIKGVSQLDL